MENHKMVGTQGALVGGTEGGLGPTGVCRCSIGHFLRIPDEATKLPST